MDYRGKTAEASTHGPNRPTQFQDPPSQVPARSSTDTMHRPTYSVSQHTEPAAQAERLRPGPDSSSVPAPSGNQVLRGPARPLPVNTSDQNLSPVQQHHEASSQAQHNRRSSGPMYSPRSPRGSPDAGYAGQRRLTYIQPPGSPDARADPRYRAESPIQVPSLTYSSPTAFPPLQRPEAMRAATAPGTEWTMTRDSAVLEEKAPSRAMSWGGMKSSNGTPSRTRFVPTGRLSVAERLEPTIRAAETERAKYARKATAIHLAVNGALGLQVLLGALTTGVAAATTGRTTSMVTCVFGAMSTVVATFLARLRGSSEPDLSRDRARDFKAWIRDAEAVVQDHGWLVRAKRPNIGSDGGTYDHEEEDHLAKDDVDKLIDDLRLRFKTLMDGLITDAAKKGASQA